MEKQLRIKNPNHLPTLAYTELIDFQGDLKHPMTPDALQTMKYSLIKHGVFVPKFVWFDTDRQANILDGHQTKQALASLAAEGWVIPPIPYVTVEASSREDAAEKLLQINSRYAEINPQTTWFDSFNFADISGVLKSIVIPTLNLSSLLKTVPNVQFKEYDESIADHVALCHCPHCGHEHARKK